ncbi:MAG TPA: L-aspartate oxidase [Deltaproteobacteria bacterium]|nr:L-aspartate oxidase [Deltaproteobacteria bacterium]
MAQQYDFIVLGSGIAGLSFALQAAEHGTVAVLTKKTSAESNTNYAQGGIASVVAPDDQIESHVHDTLEAGAGLCHEEVVRRVVSEGPRAVQELIRFGVEFSRKKSGEFDLGQEGGHSRRRVLHAGDFTGQVIEQALLHSVKAHSNIQILEHHFAIDFISTRKLGIAENQPNRCLGVYVLNHNGKNIETFLSRVTVLATGGAGKVYLYTSNPDIATGDGLAMAWRAGAKVADLEFVQFHPTCLFHPKAKSFLISEALRGEGGILRLKDGEPFMEHYDSRRELAPRDIVARAIDAELKRSGHDYVWLDMTHLPADEIVERFPNIHEKLLGFGIDMRREPIPVVPAAHYMCGGVVVNSQAETSLRNLFACGEVTFTGLHGGNRLASNSLLEAVVYADLAARHAPERLETEKFPDIEAPPWNPGAASDSDEAVVIKQNWDEIRHFMWNYVGIVRTNKRLLRAKKRIELLQEEIKEYYWNTVVTSDLLELRNIACVAELIIRSALWRKESRGLHYNLDFPSPSELYRRDTILEP